MASREKADRAAERLARNARDSYKVVLDHAVALGERNVLFARDMFGTLIREYRQQTEANLAVAQGLFERAEQQRDDFNAVVKESLDAYAGLLQVPFSRNGRGSRSHQETFRQRG